MRRPFFGLLAAIFSLVGVSVGCSKKQDEHFGTQPPDAHFGTQPNGEQGDEHFGTQPNGEQVDSAFGPNPGDG